MDSALGGFISFGVIIVLIFVAMQSYATAHLKRHNEGRCGPSGACVHCNSGHDR